MTIYLVTLIAMLNQIGFSGSRVAISLYALDLGANAFVVGLIVAIYSLCPMLFAIAIGKFADRTAPRPLMIFGAITMAAALLLPPLVSGLWTLYVAALMLGLFHQVFSIPLEAIVGGIGGPDKRARNYSVISMGWSLANFLGPIVAGFSIDYLGHREVFWVLAAIGTMPVLLLWLLPKLLPEASRHAARDRQGHSVLDLWRLPPLRVTMIAGAVIGSAKDLFQFYMPVYGHVIGLSASAIGIVLGMAALAAFVIRGAIPLVVRRLTETQILTSAVFCATLAFLLMPFFANPYALAAIAFVLGLGVGSAEPIMLSLFYVLSPKGRMAEALGLHKTLRNATQMIVPIVFGSVGAALGYSAVFLSNAAMLAISGWMTSRVGVPKSDLRQ
jgi:predicted MFS family arabinose efflux permease